MPNYFIAKLAKILKIWRICRDDLLSTPYFPCHYGILMKKGRKRDDISLCGPPYIPNPATHIRTLVHIFIPFGLHTNPGRPITI